MTKAGSKKPKAAPAKHSTGFREAWVSIGLSAKHGTVEIGRGSAVVLADGKTTLDADLIVKKVQAKVEEVVREIVRTRREVVKLHGP